LKRFVDLVELANIYGTKVLVLTQPPVIDVIGDKNAAQYLTFLGYGPDYGVQYLSIYSDVVTSNDNLKKRFNSTSNVYFFDAYSAFVKYSKLSNMLDALVIKGKDILYYDDDHLSYQGTLLLKESIKECITKIIGD